MTVAGRSVQPVSAALGAVLLVALALTTLPLAASARTAANFEDVDAQVRAAIDASAIPGLAYAVVEDGAVVHLAALGAAAPGGRSMTPQTPVVIGSVGKSITALAIRQLVEAGRVDVEAPVTRYLPWFTLAGPDGAAERMTIGSLLGHTSGLSTADGQDPARYAPGLTAEAVVRGFRAVRAERQGSYEYSNLNYVALGVVLESVTGQSYADYVSEHIFEPLGMTRSRASGQTTGDVGPDVPQGHRFLFGLPVPFDEPYPTGMVAAGYQVSTAEDMARYVAALANGGRLGGIDAVASDAAATEVRAYGTDWHPLSPGEADAIISQSGSTLSSNADIVVWPSRRLGVVVLLNANPTQLFGLPAGAADIALDVLRRSAGAGPGSAAPTIRTVYLVVDAVLLALVVAFAIHAIRARTWHRRLAATDHRGRFLARTLVADVVLPIAVLAGVPIWIGSTGSSPAGDLRAGWAFALWTLPDLAMTMLVLAIGALVVGFLKVAPSLGRPALSG